MLSKRIFVVALMLCFSGAAWATTFIAASQITPTASIQKPEWADPTFAPVANLINGKGFDEVTLMAENNSSDAKGYLQRQDYGQWLWDDPTWIANGSHGNPPVQYSPTGLVDAAWVAFTFNTPQAISNMWVWNNNSSANPYRDWKTVAIDYTTDGTTWARLGGAGYWFTFAQSPGADGYVCNNIINFGGISVKEVVLNLAINGNYSENYDFNGLSEVRFETVPEPATMILLGLGGLSLIRRKRG
jgi:hypothetical protein